MALAETRRDTKDLILDACDRIMARYGFRKMSMDDLAKEAGISKRTIYIYFKNKEDVGLSSIGRVVEQVHEQLEEISREPKGSNERLREMLRERVMGRVMQVSDYYQSLDELFEAVRPAYMARRKQYFDTEVGLIAGILEEGQSAGVFRRTEPRETAANLLLATNAFLPYSLSVRELGEPAEIAKRLESMIDLLMKSLEVKR